jgi:anti-sigma factor ChrR (cupin superfamily)
MTGAHPPPNVGDCGGDVAAYALGALEPVEADAFRTHMEACIVCPDELVAFQQIVDVLPITVAPHRAPKRLRRRVLDTIERQPSDDPGNEHRL